MARRLDLATAIAALLADAGEARRPRTPWGDGTTAWMEDLGEYTPLDSVSAGGDCA